MMNESHKYNLEERTTIFGEEIIMLCKQVHQNNVINKRIVDQLIRSGTSVGANYMEANGASSKKDFRNKIYICKKEVQETKHWLRMLKTSEPSLSGQIDKLSKETQELTLIFGKIVSTIDEKNKLQKIGIQH